MSMDKPTISLPWDSIDTVLLDMDGTLLDLHFDNYFWEEYIPRCYAKKTDLTLIESKSKLIDYSDRVRGQLEWYCLDYWSKKLSLDIAALKNEISHKISFRPKVIEFLDFLKAQNKRIILATNADPKTLELKLMRTDFSDYFNVLSSSHEIGYPKEEIAYWEALTDKYTIAPKRSLFIDDSLPVLKAANQFGIRYLLGIAKPDLQKDEVDCSPYTSIRDFSQLF
jgi:HAD superfamily hydrolase (TIGR01509 family)